jgi:hypothetical protein
MQTRVGTWSCRVDSPRKTEACLRIGPLQCCARFRTMGEVRLERTYRKGHRSWLRTTIVTRVLLDAKELKVNRVGDQQIGTSADAFNRTFKSGIISTHTTQLSHSSTLCKDPSLTSERRR